MENKMNTLTNPTSLKEKLESFLDRACEAETAGDYRGAEQLFRFALYCEGKLIPEVTDAKQYVDMVGSVYKDSGLLNQ
jgi:hypothetical protein